MHRSLQLPSQFCTHWALSALLRTQSGAQWAWGSAAATEARGGALFSSSSSSSTSDAAVQEPAPQQQQQQQPLLYAACVLERLPVRVAAAAAAQGMQCAN